MIADIKFIFPNRLIVDFDKRIREPVQYRILIKLIHDDWQIDECYQAFDENLLSEWLTPVFLDDGIILVYNTQSNVRRYWTNKTDQIPIIIFTVNGVEPSKVCKFTFDCISYDEYLSWPYRHAGHNFPFRNTK